MGEVVKFPGHRYEFRQINYYYEIYKNGNVIGIVSDIIPGVQRFTYGFESSGSQMWFSPENQLGWETVKEAISALELEILHATENKDNIGTTRNWEDYYALE